MLLQPHNLVSPENRRAIALRAALGIAAGLVVYFAAWPLFFRLLGPGFTPLSETLEFWLRCLAVGFAIMLVASTEPLFATRYMGDVAVAKYFRGPSWSAIGFRFALSIVGVAILGWGTIIGTKVLADVQTQTLSYNAAEAKVDAAIATLKDHANTAATRFCTTRHLAFYGTSYDREPVAISCETTDGAITAYQVDARRLGLDKEIKALEAM